MNTSILAALRGEARDWWAHKDLRAQGKHAEAAERERTSIRSDLQTLRAVLATPNGYVSCGRGGTSIHTSHSTLSSYSSLARLACARIAIALGVPFVDTRPVAQPTRLISLPLVALHSDPDPLPWDSLSYIPLPAYLHRARALGAYVVNWPSPPSTQTGDL